MVGVGVAFAARNGFNGTDTNVSDFLTVRQSRAVESKIVDFAQSMLVNRWSLIIIFRINIDKEITSVFSRMTMVSPRSSTNIARYDESRRGVRTIYKKNMIIMHKSLRTRYSK